MMRSDLIVRKLEDQLRLRLKEQSKIIILYGARQVGKTTLIKTILNDSGKKILQINADEIKYRDVLSSMDLNQLKGLVSGYDILFLDEAQRIPNIGINLKILYDNIPELKIIATGSSSFELANKISEPLTGRTWTYTLYPIALLEWSNLLNPFEIEQRINDYLRFGQYPEIFNYENESDKIDYLLELSQSLLYKDLLELSYIKNASKIYDLLKLLAYQIGQLVSFSELGRQLGLSTETVMSYVDLLCKSFVIFQLPGYSKNLRKEITKNKKVYFYDIGIRNALIDNFSLPDNRPDVGQLWENFIIVERIKRNKYLKQHSTHYFWRTYTGAELDLVEVAEELSGFEIKYGVKEKKVPKTWAETYKEARYLCVNKNNYLEFLT